MCGQVHRIFFTHSLLTELKMQICIIVYMITRSQRKDCGSGCHGCWSRNRCKNELLSTALEMKIPAITEGDNTGLIGLSDCT